MSYHSSAFFVGSMTTGVSVIVGVAVGGRTIIVLVGATVLVGVLVGSGVSVGVTVLVGSGVSVGVLVGSGEMGEIGDWNATPALLPAATKSDSASMAASRA